MPSARQPRFVVLEGLDGAGTTTQARRLAEALEGRGLDVCLTAEPSEGPLGSVAWAHLRHEITLDPVTAALTFVADRADHVARVLGPALRRGEWVVCDRYVLSTLAYQGAEGVDRLWVLEASGPLPIPDLTVVLEVPAGERERRMAARPAADRYEAAELQARISVAYAESIELLRSRGHRIVQIDGTAPEAAVHATIKAELDALA